MPIILDQNAQDPKDTKKQLSNVNKQIQSARTETAKWFNTTLTGSSTRKVGFFNTEHHTLNHLAEKAVNKIGSVQELDYALSEMFEKETIRYYSNEKGDKGYYTPFARALTETVWPSLFATNIAGHLPNGNQTSIWDALVTTQDAITFPSNTALFGLMNLKSWTELTNTNGVKTVVKPIVQSIQLHSSKHKSSKANQKYEYTVAGEPLVFLAVASFTDTVNDDATIRLTPHENKPTDDSIAVSILPVPFKQRDHFLMNSTSGVEWSALIDDALDRHYDRADLHDLNANRIGQLTVDRVKQDMVDVIGELSLCDALNSQANTLVHQIEDQITCAIDALTAFAHRQDGTGHEDPTNEVTVRAIKLIVQIMDHISHKEETLITTDFLNTIYNQVKRSSFDPNDVNQIVQESLRLLLSQRLHELQAVEQAGNLYQFSPADQSVTQKYMADKNYSSQQKRIVTTTKPLVIGQAGAGSGKSHTLVGRINYMKEQQEDLSKVLVLSFTNISALNINQRFPGIRSETLANMFNKIYQNTYPSQQLSQPSTVANSLRLLNPKTNYFKSKGFNEDDVKSYIREFSTTLAKLDQTGFKRVNIQEVTKQLANLIQHNMVLTEALLDAVEQTTLELQPIIIHHHLMNNHGQLNVPKEYSDLNYIITDESQDISTFEYILLLELAIHHSAQLMIVGDGSQTLYEFRNSDPRYMNALESSGVFTTYKLDVNYRSKPEILTFANQFLDVIDANDIAKIQLKSKTFNTPTQKSFESAITIHNVLTGSSKPQDYHETLVNLVGNNRDFDTWFRDKIDKGEQIAVLGWTRKEVTETGEAIENWLKNNNYDIEVTNIMNDKSRPMTVISSALSAIHRDILKMDPTANSFKSGVNKLASHYIDTKFKYSSPKQKNFFTGTFERALDQVMAMHQWTILKRDVKAGNVTRRAAIGHITREMLRIETRKNAMDAYLQRPEEAPDYSKKRIILSTIHGAKGLEFDNTIVLFNEGKRGATNQEALRMLFVALSRAKSSEYIINAHTRTHAGVSDTLSAMFDTPMQTAFMRASNAIANAKP